RKRPIELPLVEPEYRTLAQVEDAARKRETRKAEAAAIRAEVQARAEHDDRLRDCDRATLRAMLDWATEHNAACCWAGRATLARRAGYSVGAVKRSVMDLERYGYFVSEGAGGSAQMTAKRTFTRG